MLIGFETRIAVIMLAISPNEDVLADSTNPRARSRCRLFEQTRIIRQKINPVGIGQQLGFENQSNSIFLYIRALRHIARCGNGNGIAIMHIQLNRPALAHHSITFLVTNCRAN